MAIDEAGQYGTPGETNYPGPRSDQRFEIGKGAMRHNPIAGNGDRITGRMALDSSVIEDEVRFPERHC